MFASSAAVPDANAVTIEDYVDDAKNWVSAIREKTGAAYIWVLGHSEGGLVTLSTDGNDEHICGLILVATPGRPLGKIIEDQLRANPANEPLLAGAISTIEQLEVGNHVDAAAIHPALLPLFNPAI